MPALKQLCEEDDSVGFNWDEGRYKRAFYRLSKFTLVLVDPTNPNSGLSSEEQELAELQCITYPSEIANYEYDDFRVYKSCIRKSEFGGGEAEFFVCSEYHWFDKDTESWEISFDCEQYGDLELQFTPNEFFHSYFLHGQTTAFPTDDYKDSLSISVGRCSSIVE